MGVHFETIDPSSPNAHLNILSFIQEQEVR